MSMPNMEEYKLLVIGNLYDNHLIRFIRNLKSCNNKVIIDVLSINAIDRVPSEVEDIVRKVHFFRYKTSSIRIIRVIQRIVLFNTFLKEIAKNEHYDIVNIHFPTFDYSFSVSNLKKLADKIVLTPWGSDIYRVGKLRLSILKYLYRKADYVCNPNTRFGKDVREILSLKKEQIVNLSMGSETIDYIIENKNNISVVEARKVLSLEGDYFITCGYNAHIAQNHKAIIDGVAKFNDRYPGKISLLFPMTYPKNVEYVDEIKQYVNDKGLNAYFFTDYLDLPTIFKLRQSTDMFIHVQNTDANSASVQEYLLLGKKVLNGEWLRYDNMEIDGEIPYTLVKDLSSVSDAIEKALKEDIKISTKLHEYLESSGWKEWILHWDAFFKQITC